MGFRDTMRRVADNARRIAGPSFVDIRTNQLTIRKRTWSGTRIASGTAVDTDLVLPARYPIRYLMSQDLSGVAGSYETGDLLVDHITPFDGVSVGYTPEQLRPTITTDNVELLYVITGDHAGFYDCVELRTYRAFTFQLVLRRNGQTP